MTIQSGCNEERAYCQREYALLLALAKNRDQACSRDDLLNQVWGVDFIGGVQLMSIGVIGEYLSKVLVEVKHRPRFIVDQHLK